MARNKRAYATVGELEERCDKLEQNLLSKREFDLFVGNHFHHLAAKVDEIESKLTVNTLDTKRVKQLSWTILGAFLGASLLEASGLLELLLRRLLY